MPCDLELTDDALWIGPLRERQRRGYTSDDRERLQVQQDMPRVAQHDRIVATYAVRPRDGHRRRDGALSSRAHPGFLLAEPVGNARQDDPRLEQQQPLD